MKPLATREDGHLLVAAVRVLTHTLKHPPTDEDVAALLGLSREWVGVMVTSLKTEGILATVDSAFVSRIEIRDHSKLEALPGASEDSGIREEIREFAEQKRREEKELGEIFSGGEATRRQTEKLDRMAADFTGFKPKPPRSSPLFREPGPDEE